MQPERAPSFSLEQLLNSSSDEVFKKIIMAGRHFNLLKDQIMTLLSFFNDYARECPSNFNGLYRADFNAFYKYFVSLTPEIQQQIQLQFQKEFEQSTSYINQFNLFLNALSHPSLLTKTLKWQQQNLMDTQDKLHSVLQNKMKRNHWRHFTLIEKIEQLNPYVLYSERQVFFEQIIEQINQAKWEYQIIEIATAELTLYDLCEACCHRIDSFDTSDEKKSYMRQLLGQEIISSTASHAKQMDYLRKLRTDEVLLTVLHQKAQQIHIQLINQERDIANFIRAQLNIFDDIQSVKKLLNIYFPKRKTFIDQKHTLAQQLQVLKAYQQNVADYKNDLLIKLDVFLQQNTSSSLVSHANLMTVKKVPYWRTFMQNVSLIPSLGSLTVFLLVGLRLARLYHVIYLSLVGASAFFLTWSVKKMLLAASFPNRYLAKEEEDFKRTDKNILVQFNHHKSSELSFSSPPSSPISIRLKF